MNEIACETSKGCICLLCGIPGSGKTYFMERIKEHFNSSVDFWSAYFVQFDEVVPIERQRRLLGEDKGFKRSRQSFVNASKLFISYLIDEQHARQQTMDEETQRIVELILKVNSNVEKQAFVLFVEDNFYLRSMRYEFVKLAKHFSLGFVQLIFDTSLHICLSRNENRVNKVPEEFIIKMNTVFEKSNAEKYKWESNSLLLNRADIGFENICVLIKEAITTPFAEVFDDSEQRLCNRRINNENVMHQFDCLLRRIIRDEIKESKSCERRQVAEQLTKRKAQLLRQSLDVPDWFADEIIGKNGLENDTCKVFAKKLLYCQELG